MPMGAWPAGDGQVHRLVHPIGPDNSAVVVSADFHIATGGTGVTAEGKVMFIGAPRDANSPEPSWLGEQAFRLVANIRQGFACPANTDQIVVYLDKAQYEVGWSLVLAAK